MPKVSLQWTGDWQFAAADSNEVQVNIDGEQQMGAKPSDLLPMALASCSGIDLLQVIGEADDAEITALRVDARYTQEPSAPWAFQRIRLHYVVEGRGLTDEAVEDAIRRSEEELCSVAATLRGNVEITSSHELADADADED